VDLVELKATGQIENPNRHPWEQARSVFVANQIRKRFGVNDAMTILDIGCGDTYVAETLLEDFPNSTFYCIDIAFTPELMAHYSEKYKNTNIHVYTDMNDAVADIEKEISFILLLDVVEHIEEDVSFLKQVHQLNHVTENTNLFITVPAFQSLFTNHDTLLGHYRRYTNVNLKRTLKSAGFKSDSLGYFFTSLLLPRILEKAKEKMFGIKNDSTDLSVWDKGEGVTSMVKNVLVLDTKITGFFEMFGINIIGLSNYIICKKVG